MLNKKNSVIIFDDIFPSIYSPFRYEEYIEYLKNLDNVYIYTTGKSLKAVSENRSLTEVIKEFEEKYPEYQGKVLELNERNKKILEKLENKVAICTFLANIKQNINLIEEYKIPFIFTLYPGGGFVINDQSCDLLLKRICNSKYFKKVIVTQKNVYKYLIDKKICNRKQIEFIYGVVTPAEILNETNKEKKYYKNDKNTLDICFVAHKYMEKGIDKGYDLFIETAKKLNDKYFDICYHVIGGFDENDIDVKELKDKIVFYGIKDSNWLKNFYKNMDIIISPNRPFKLGKGSFDGFPTGSCTEAMINGVLLLCTDELNLNVKFKDNKDLIIIKPEVSDITAKLEELYHNTEKIIKIANNGKEKTKKIYSKESQIKPRIKLIRKVAKKHYRY